LCRPGDGSYVLHTAGDTVLYVTTGNDDIDNYEWAGESYLWALWKEREKGNHQHKPGSMPVWIRQGLELIDYVIHEEREDERRRQENKTWATRR
jgi:hypothetical protein